MMHSSKSLKVLLVALGLLVASQVPVSTPAHAAVACDPKIMEALNARAWREAQREVMTNETYIYKPDSVFALSCFSDALGRVPTGFSSGNATTATSDALNAYMSGNFNHGYLGGGTAGAQGTNDCTRMRALWGTAHCNNLAYTSPTANAFASLAYGSDPRLAYPAACTNPGTWGSTNTLITTVGVGATYDSPNLFLGVTDPLASLTASTNCSPGILTGVEIGTASTTYQEKVCPNPGCVPKYDSGNMKCCDQTNLSNRCEP